MVNKRSLFFVILIFGILLSFSFVSALEINGTIMNVDGIALNDTNISVLVKNQAWSQIWYNVSKSNESGWFNITVPGNMASGFFYQLSISHYNTTLGAIDWVGQSFPLFPFPEFSRLSNVSFYLKEAGTMVITAVNSSGNLTNFAAQVKDTKLGYPISSCTSSSDSKQTTCYLPKDRNYSIMIYPSESGAQTQFMPVSFSWNNFSASSDYNITAFTSYNATKKILQKRFNVTQSTIRLTGFVNVSYALNRWDSLTLVPFLLEPGNMIFMTYGTLPYNMSAWSGSTDEYNLTSGYYNITLPYAPQETTGYVLYAAARNGSIYYGAYKNVTMGTGGIGADTQINFTTLYGLLGDNANISMNSASNWAQVNVSTKRQYFTLVNASTNASLSNMSAHIELTVDYSNYGAKEFTFMDDVSSGAARFSMPLLNVTGFKEANVFTMNGAPKKIQSRTAMQIIANPNISISPFSPGDISGTDIASSISVYLYKSNSSCDAPSPASNCLLTSTSGLTNFNPFAVVMGGGKISFRMGLASTGILIHYVNVDLLASGPPDVLFDSSTSESTSGAFSSALRFGSTGPTIYDYVLISIPYTEGSSSQTGLNENADINMSIPTFYDENWNSVWSTASNGTSASSFAANYSHYYTRRAEWEYLMNNTNCTGTVSEFNASRPCYIDTTNNRIWVRLPHFSGTSPSVTGSVITATSGGDDNENNGGAGGGETYWLMTFNVNDSIFKEAGYNSNLAIKQRVRIKINGTEHYVGIVNITSNSATINVSSTPQQAIFAIGDSKKFELTGDDYYDLKVTLNSISGNKANITLSEINEKMPDIGTPENNETQETGGEKTGEAPEGKKSIWLMWIIIIAVIAVIAIVIYYILSAKIKR